MYTINEVLSRLIVFFSPVDQCWVARCPVFPVIVGGGNTAEAARADFEMLLNEQWDDYVAGNHVLASPGQRGRPKLYRESLNTSLLPEFKDKLDAIAKQHQCSKGEAIEYLITLYDYIVTAHEMAGDNQEPA